MPLGEVVKGSGQCNQGSAVMSAGVGSPYSCSLGDGALGSCSPGAAVGGSL
jgi:hypothetical protein